jgi:histidinol-phosphate aminotransferase
MRARKVLIKNVSSLHGLLDNCLRITVGTADENAKMLTVLKEALQP